MPEKVALIGSGNWGSAIATKIGKNVLENDMFDQKFYYLRAIPRRSSRALLNQTHEIHHNTYICRAASVPGSSPSCSWPC